MGFVLDLFELAIGIVSDSGLAGFGELVDEMHPISIVIIINEKFIILIMSIFLSDIIKAEGLRLLLLVTDSIQIADWSD